MLRPVLVALLAALILVACGGGASKPAPTPTDEQPGPTVAKIIVPTPLPGKAPREVEADADPSLPGEYVNLPAIYGGYYGNRTGPNTAAHRRGPIDYSVQGLPPAGGPHWGAFVCPNDPIIAPPNCGPVPWGIYRTPWPAESLVHNMEHAGVVIWYNTSHQNVIDKLESLVRKELNRGHSVVLTPYPEMAADSIALTAWSRRDEFSIDDYDANRITKFLNVHLCRFDPERLCILQIQQI